MRAGPTASACRATGEVSSRGEQHLIRASHTPCDDTALGASHPCQFLEPVSLMWFPVVAHDVADAERLLGVALPPRYKALVSDPLVRQALANPLLGALLLDRSMIAHVKIVKERALALAEFPDRAVIAADNGGRYVRFWLPDPKRPGTLGEMVFSWDTLERRSTKDAASSTIIRSMLSLLAPRAAEAPRVNVYNYDVGDATRAAARGDNPNEPQWIVCGTFELEGAILAACDAGLHPDPTSSVSVKSGPGVYRVDVLHATGDPSFAHRITALRMVRADAQCAHVTAVVELDVDHAAIAIYDRQHYFRRVRTGDRDAFLAELSAAAPRLAAVGMRGRRFAVRVATMRGDGTFAVSALSDGHKAVGLQIGLTGTR